jgi:tetratricopeptide (TPR) repeat protein
MAGGAIAAAAGDAHTVRLVRLGEASIAVNRGNYPLAEQLLDDVLATAHAAGDKTAFGRAAHDRGVVAHARGDLAFAVYCLHKAIDIYAGDPGRQDRALCDLGRAFQAAGHVDAARDAFVTVRARAPEAGQRTRAGINLLSLESEVGDSRAFNRLVRELDRERLTARDAAYYHLDVAEGYLVFGRIAFAKDRLRAAAAAGRRAQVNEAVLRAEELLKATAPPKRPTRLALRSPWENADIENARRIVAELRAASGA